MALEYASLIWRQRWPILACAVTGLLLGVLWTLPQTPLYRAHTSMDIQDLNENFLNLRAVDPTALPSNASAESYLQTQIKLLQSDTTLQRTVARMLQAPARTAAPAKDADAPSWLSWKSSQPASREETMQQIARSVKVRPLGMARLVEITCDSPEAQLATDFCNTLTKEFIAQSFEVRRDAARQTSDWLSDQMADTRAKLEMSERKLQGYAKSNALFLDQQRESVSQEKLRQLQNELSKAQAERISKQAQHEMTLGGNVNPDSLPLVLDSGPMREYQVKLSDLRRQAAEIGATLTPDHPKSKRVQAELRELENSIRNERANVIGRIKNEYAAAQQRERLLGSAYNTQESVVSSQTSRATEYNMLRREVDSGRQLYETLLQRVKEAGFAIAMRASTMRVVDAAAVPMMPISPSRTKNGAVGLVLGGLAGVVFAFTRERSDRRLRVPGDAVTHLRVRELGVVPSARVDDIGRSLLPGSWRNTRMPRHITLSLAAPGEEMQLSEKQAGRLELIALSNGASLLAEAYRMIVSSLLFADPDGGLPQVMVVSSPSISEGKTTLVSNLGISLAETKRRVLLIDGDLRRPRLHEVFDINNEQELGLRAVLRGEVDAKQGSLSEVVRSTFVPNLSILPSGRGEDRIASLLHSSHLPVLLERLRGEYDVVLIDSPPMLNLSDARLLGHLSDGVVLVFRAGATTMDTAQGAAQFFEADGTRVLGTVLNDFQPNRDPRWYGYRNYYGPKQKRA